MNIDVVVYKTATGRLVINTLAEWEMWIANYKVPKSIIDSAKQSIVSELFYNAVRNDSTQAVQGVLREVWEGTHGYKFEDGPGI